MRFTLAPKEDKFFGMFARAADTVLDGVRLFKEMLEDYTDVEAKAKAIKEIELKGDNNTHEIVESLNRTFVTPLDRDDIHSLATSLDDILDYAEALASRMVLYNIREITPEMRQFAGLMVQAAEEIAKALHDLKRFENLQSFCRRIKTLENLGDDLSRQVIADLYRNEKDPIRIFVHQDIYARMEATMDRCEDVANTIESIVVKNA